MTTLETPGTTGPDHLAGPDDNASWGLPPAPAYGWRGRAAKRVLARVLRKVPVTVRLASGEVYGAGDPPSIAVTDPESLFARLGASPMIGLGESYMAGEWSSARGSDLAEDPIDGGPRLVESERDRLGLRGLLPPCVNTMQGQADRVLTNLRNLPTDDAVSIHVHLVTAIPKDCVELVNGDRRSGWRRALLPRTRAPIRA